MKILIIRLSSIGDCVLSSPVAQAVRARYPDAHLTWIVERKSAPVVCGLPELDNVMVGVDQNAPGYKSSRLQMRWKVWRERFDIALDLQGEHRAGRLLGASRAPRRISGESLGRVSRRFSTEQVAPYDTIKATGGPMHARLKYLHLASALDIAPDAPARFFPKVPLTCEHEAQAAALLGERGVNASYRLLGLNLGASKPPNRWPAARLAQLADACLRADAQARVLAFGAPADAPLLRDFEQEFARLNERPAAPAPERVLNFVGQATLMQIAALARRCDVFLTADTGPMHIAAAAGAPVLALFGPADPRHTGPVQRPDGAPVRVLNARDFCSQRPAPMETFSVEQVHEAVRAFC